MLSQTWKSDNFMGSNTERSHKTQKTNKKNEINIFCDGKIGKVITLWETIEKSDGLPIIILDLGGTNRKKNKI